MGKAKIAAVDAGNGGCNAVVNGKPSYIPSVRAAATGDSLGLGPQWELQYDFVDWNGHRYVVGDDVLRVTRKALERHMGHNRYGNEFHQFLVATALARAGVKEGEVDLTVFAPPGMFAELRQYITGSFSGSVSIRLRNDKKPREWQYSSVTVWPEGLAMAAALILDEKGRVVNADLLSGDVLVLDLGVHTLDAVLLSNGNFNPEELQSATWENGGADVHIRQPVLNMLHGQSEDFAHASVDDIDRLLRDTESIIRMGGAQADLTTVLNKYAERYAEWIANNVIDGRFNGLRGIRSCIVGGGVGPREETLLRKWYGDKIFDRNSNARAHRYHPGYWNAWGGYNLRMAQKSVQS